MDAEALVRPVIEREGFELVEAALSRDAGRKVLRVTVDRPDGLDLDTVSELSTKLSRHLDEQGVEEELFALEVSSPGIERPLKKPSHFERAVGQQVTVTLTATDDAARAAVHTGALLRADDEGIVLLAGGGELRVPYGEIASARTVADWAAELKRSHA